MIRTTYHCRVCRVFVCLLEFLLLEIFIHLAQVRLSQLLILEWDGGVEPRSLETRVSGENSRQKCEHSVLRFEISIITVFSCAAKQIAAKQIAYVFVVFIDEI